MTQAPMTKTGESRARVDIYTPAHKGLRALVSQTAKEIHTADYSSPADLERIADAVDRTLEFMDEHARAEETVIHAALREVEPEVVATLETQHHELDAIAERVRALASAVRAAKEDPTNAAAALTALDRAFSRWIGGHLVHMVNEEENSLPALWKHFDDARIIGLRTSIQNTLGPERMAQWLRLFFRGMSVPEVGDMLAGVKAAAPAPVYEQMARLAQDELGPRWEAAKLRGKL